MRRGDRPYRTALHTGHRSPSQKDALNPIKGAKQKVPLLSASRGPVKTLAASRAVRLPAPLKGDTAFSTGPGWTPQKQLRAVTPYQSPVSWQRPPRRPQTRRWRPPAAVALSEAPTGQAAPSAAVAPASPTPQGPAQSCASTLSLKDQVHFLASACFPRWPHLTTGASQILVGTRGGTGSRTSL